MIIRERRTKAFPRERFSTEVALSPAMVAAFANAAGDDNPIHHDAAFAAKTRYGTPNEKLKSDIAELRGRIKGQDGRTALGAKGRILITEQL